MGCRVWGFEFRVCAHKESINRHMISFLGGKELRVHASAWGPGFGTLRHQGLFGTASALGLGQSGFSLEEGGECGRGLWRQVDCR